MNQKQLKPISMFADIKKELQAKKVKQAETVDTNKAVNEVKLLMAGDSAEDLRIFRSLSNNNNVVQAERALGKKMEFENLEKKYGEVFTIAQIKSLAIKYNLKFLNSRSYNGNFDTQVAGKIKEFSKETGTEISEANLMYNYYILAPAEAFHLKEVLVKKHIPDPDPLIFYKIDEGHYRLIHKWGNDFTFLRIISGLKWESYGSWKAFTFLKLYPIITVLVGAIIGFISPFPAMTFVTFGLGAIASYLLAGFWGNEEHKYDERHNLRGVMQDHFSEEGWRSETKTRSV